jgi:alkanesulfonate monooxygenase SsuD/methylene tetrahydromethanopterin reductase-like flavin-dependent oxidoreductase (luciferase family)
MRTSDSVLRFGVDISGPLGADPAAEARHAESLGFDVVTLHGDVLDGPRVALEPWTALTWVASRTTGVLVAPNVLVLPNRHPAVLAKMAATLDRLSGGRLVLALGAGAAMNAGAFRAFGLEPASVAALEEAVDVIRGLWTTAPFSYTAGRHFRVEGASLEPRPDRPPPIWLGAYGARMLDLTGRKADGWLPSMFLLPPPAAAEAMERVREAAARAGRDPDALTYGYNVGVLVDEGARPTAGRIAGAPTAVAERLADLARRGFTFLNLWPAGGARHQRERLATEVLPLVRR